MCSATKCVTKNTCLPTEGEVVARCCAGSNCNLMALTATFAFMCMLGRVRHRRDSRQGEATFQKHPSFAPTHPQQRCECFHSILLSDD